ncbi:MAG: hypothetical protein HS132_08030 [Planctomycetia bacterium]|nr:hypothetical protein [Planctomycetia bacterium]
MEKNLKDKCNICLFDNHNRIYKTLEEYENIKNSFRHPTGTEEDFKCKSIFDLLQNFPRNFTGMYTLLLLLESAITKCLIIDERVIHTVVGNSVKDNEEIRIKDKCRHLKQAGCYIPAHLITNNGKYLCLLKDEKYINSIPRKKYYNRKEDTNIINVNEEVYIV